MIFYVLNSAKCLDSRVRTPYFGFDASKGLSFLFEHFLNSFFLARMFMFSAWMSVEHCAGVYKNNTAEKGMP